MAKSKITESLYWHDYETFGINPSKDRIAQFAGVRTDTQLNIIGKPLVEYCKLTPDIIPDPGACLVTGILPQLANQKGLIEAKFAGAIFEEFSQEGTCTVGYNSSNFDDEFTRYLFYRNFYDPYKHHSEAQGNSRWDLINVVRLMRAVRPDGPLIWPQKECGKYSTRLEDITKANGISHEGAHDALSDVYATLDLARLLLKHYPRMYSYCYAHRTKSMVSKLLGIEKRQLRNPKPLLHIDSFYGSDNNYMAIIYPVAMHPAKGNSVIAYNIMHDPAPLLELSPSDLQKKLFTKKEDLAAGDTRVGMHEINANKCPVLVPLDKVSAESRERLGIDKQRCISYVRQINEKSDVSFVAQKAYFRTFEPKQDPELMLYDGFLEKHDKVLLKMAQATPPSSLKSTKFDFHDERLPELLFRYRARNFPETLDPAEQQKFEKYCALRYSSEDISNLTLEQYFNLIDEKLATDLSDDKKKLLQELRIYGQNTFVR